MVDSTQETFKEVNKPLSLGKYRQLTVIWKNAQHCKQKKKTFRQKSLYMLIKLENDYKMIKPSAGRDAGK